MTALATICALLPLERDGIGEQIGLVKRRISAEVSFRLALLYKPIRLVKE